MAEWRCHPNSPDPQESQRLVVLVSGKKIADGGPEAVIRDPEVERAYLGE